jgi:hypothetical protein
VNGAARLSAILLAALAGAALVLQINAYPLSRGLLASGLALYAIALARWPRLWVAVLPAALPLPGLAPWSGLVALEEFDTLLLATLVLEHARRALMPAAPARLLPVTAAAGAPDGTPAAFLDTPTVAVLALGALIVAVGLWRGLLPLPGFDPSLLATYDSRFNALRLAKPAVLALAFQPLIVDALCRDPASTLRRLKWGLATGLVIAAVLVGWEQWLRYGHGASALPAADNHPTLTPPAIDGNAIVVPSPGRASTVADVVRAAPPGSGPNVAAPLTAGFWEMHVGGAALDAFLLMTFPAAGWLIAGSLPPPRRRDRRTSPTLARHMAAGVPVAGMVGCAILALGVLALASLGAWQSWVTAVGSTAFAVVAWMLSRHAQATAARPRRAARAGAAVADAALDPDADATADGESFASIAPGGLDSAGALAPPPFAHQALEPPPPIPHFAMPAPPPTRDAAAAKPKPKSGVRPPGDAVARMVPALLCVAAMIGVVGSLDDPMDDGPLDGLVGHGLGTLPASALRRSGELASPGAHHLHRSGNDRWLVLDGPHRTRTGLPQYRVQQILGQDPALAARGAAPPSSPSSPSSPPATPAAGRAEAPVTLRVRLVARALITSRLLAQVCRPRVDGGAACLRAQLTVPAAPDDAPDKWAPLDAALTGRLAPPAPGAPAVFSLASLSADRSIAIDDLRLLDPDDRDLLANGEFDQGMTHWFFTTDGPYDRWQAGSLRWAILFDLGVAGLFAASLLGLVAVARLAGLVRAGDEAAPWLLGALAGGVGLGFSTALVDATRLTWLLLFLVLVAVVQRQPLATTRARRRARNDRAAPLR